MVTISLFLPVKSAWTRTYSPSLLPFLILSGIISITTTFTVTPPFNITSFIIICSSTLPIRPLPPLPSAQPVEDPFQGTQNQSGMRKGMNVAGNGLWMVWSLKASARGSGAVFTIFSEWEMRNPDPSGSHSVCFEVIFSDFFFFKFIHLEDPFEMNFYDNCENSENLIVLWLRWQKMRQMKETESTDYSQILRLYKWWATIQQRLRHGRGSAQVSGYSNISPDTVIFNHLLKIISQYSDLNQCFLLPLTCLQLVIWSL